MVIGFDASRANRKIKTGVEWHSFYLLKALARIDRQNTYWLYTDEPLEPELRDLGPNFIEKRLRWPSRYLWTQGRLSLEMLRRPPDALFVPASIIPLFHPKRTATILHDVGFLSHPEAYSLPGRLYQKLAIFLAKAGGKRVITISEFTKSELVRLCAMKPERIRVIPVSYNKSIYHHNYSSQERAAARDRHGIRTPYIFTAGALSKKKNALGIVKAFEMLRSSPGGEDYQLIMAGKENHGFAEAREEIRSCEIAPSVIFPGWVSAQDMPLLLSGAACFLLPSFYEGFGIPVIEAFACGVPVIVSDRASLPEVAGGAALLVDPEDPRSIYRALKSLIEDPQLRQDLVTRGLRRAGDFSYSDCARQTKAFLESL